MSYQLIYHHQLRKSPQGENNSVIVKSRDIPAWLENVVLHRSRTTGVLPQTPCYSYRVISAETGVYHLLTCAANHGLHHLILTPAEETKLRRNNNRPTPAGIILALQSTHFWVTDVTHPSLHCEEPRLAASSLPAADFQETWKKLTGHKNNARIFQTSPYHKECLVQVPQNTTTEDILRLIHESDWISSLRGWGRTFTTQALPGASFEETSRIFFQDSQIEQPFIQDLLPHASFLRLTKSLNLSESTEQEIRPAASSEAEQMGAARLTGTASATDTHQPYIYLESPDEDTYNIAPCSHPILRWSLYAAGLLLLGFCVHLMVSETADDAGKATRKAIASITPDDNLLQLKELSQAPYSPDSITRTLDKIYAHLSNAAPDANITNKEQLLEIVSILKYAATDTTGHATNISRLRECAAKLQLNQEELCRLYLNEATHDCSPQDWAHNLHPAEKKAWEQLITQAPTIKEILLSPTFEEYGKIILSDNTKEHITTETPSPQTSPQQDSHAKPPITCVVGSQIPESFNAALQHVPFTIQVGNWSLIRRYAGTTHRTRYCGQLSDKGTVLRVEQTGEDEYTITPLAEDNNLPPLHLKIKEGILTELQSERNPAAAIIPLPDTDNGHTPLMLLPYHELILHPLGEGAPPDAAQLNMGLQEQDIVLQTETDTGLRYLEVPATKGFPWTRMLSELPLNHAPVVLNLPILTGGNKLSTSSQSNELNYCWSYSKLPTSDTTSDLFVCHLLRIHDFSPKLRQAFHHQANTYCMGKHRENTKLSFFSLATLYACCQDYNDKAMQQKAAADLCQLSRNPDFTPILSAIIPQHSTSSVPARNISERTAATFLAEASNRLVMRQGILMLLSDKLKQVYTNCRQEELQLATPPPKMMMRLKAVNINEQGELIWKFELRSTK